MKFITCVAVILLAAFFLSGSSCNDQIVRDRETYKAEVNLMEQFSVQQANILAEFIKTDCKCVKDDFPNEQCTRAAVIVILVRRRIKWHKDMMLYNAGLLPENERPSKEPPDTPAPQTLCP